MEGQLSLVNRTGQKELQLITGKWGPTSLILLLAITYQMLFYTSYKYITTVNHTTTDRHWNLFWIISFLFSCPSRFLLWGWRNSARLTLHHLTSYSSCHLFLPGVTATGLQNCLGTERKKLKIKTKINNSLPLLHPEIFQFESNAKTGRYVSATNEFFPFLSLQIFAVVAGLTLPHLARFRG